MSKIQQHIHQNPSDVYINREDNRCSVVLMYRIIQRPRDKFILMAVVESGYKQEEVARMLGISQEYVNQRLRYVKEMLKLHEDKVII